MSDPIAITEEQLKDIPSTEQAANDLRQAAGIKSREIAQSAEERAQLLKDSAAQKAQKLRNFAGEKASQFADVAGEHWEETRVKAREIQSDIEEYVRQHPSKSILVAAGVGFLLGLVVRR